MAGPWEKYAQPRQEGPWSRFAQPSADAAPEPAAPAQEPQSEQPGVLADVAKSAGAGLANAAVGLAGLPRAAGDFGGFLADKATDLIFGDEAPNAPDFTSRLQPPSSEAIQSAVEGVTGEFYQPQTTAGDYARTFAEFLPAAAAGPGGIARRVGAQVAAPAVASETAGQVTEGSELEPYARMAGAVAGALAPSVAARAVTPFPITAERAAFVRTLENEGVPLSAGQITGNRGLQYAESLLEDLPGPMASPRARAFRDQQGDAFSTAAMRRVGENAPATPDTVRAARDRIGQQFDDISSRNSVIADQDLANDIGATVMEYARVLPANQKQVFGNMAGDIVDVFANGGTMPGKQYQEIRSRLSRMAQSARQNDPEFSNALRGLRNSLDDAFRRQVRPEDAAGLDTARRQYGNLKTVERAATGGGEGAAFGRMTPAQLRQSVASGNNRGAYARGEGDFADLARAGQAVMTPLPNSGTGQRNAVAGLLGGGAVGAMIDPVTAASAVAAPAVASRALWSRPGQAYLSNQVMTRLQSLPARQRALIAAALAERGITMGAPPSQ